jgi:phage terminase small subunit
MSGKANNANPIAPNGLTDLEYNFCWAYAKTLHLGNAVKEAGYKCAESSARVYGTRLLKKANIRSYLNEIMDLSTVTVLNKVVQIAFANITDIMSINSNGVTIIPSQQWSDRAKAAVKSVKIKTRTSYDKEGNPIITTETEIAMYDRLSALDKLMRKLAMYPTQGDVLSLVEAMATNGLLVPGQADVVIEGINGIRDRLKELPGDGA